jgi:hypothetical protein
MTERKYDVTVDGEQRWFRGVDFGNKFDIDDSAD